MNEGTPNRSAVEPSNGYAAEQLLPLVYEELRKLAARRLAQERPGQTLDSAALVHEAYLRLRASTGPEGVGAACWANRAHFFAAAAEAMRRILVEQARRKQRLRRGGGWKRIDFDSENLVCRAPPDELLMIDEALTRLTQEDPRAAELVKLRYFAGVPIQEAAELMGLSRSTAYEHWAYARAWLFHEMQGREDRP